MRIDELRATLDQDTSAALHGSAHETAARVGAVHARVARLRRRRRATALGATVAAAVATVATLVVPPLVHDAAPQPAGHAPSVLAGRQVPTTQTATGFGYHYVQGVQSRPGQQALRLDVKVGDRPRLVMWASSGGAGTLRLASDSDQNGPEVSTAGGFDRYAYLPAGGYTDHLRLTQAGGRPGDRLALAVYDLDERPAAGVTNGTVTYRRQVLEDQLVTAHLGAAGDNDVRFDLRLPSGLLRWSDTCYGAGEDGWYVLSVNGHDWSGADCAKDPEIDPGPYGSTFDQGSPLDDQGVRPGDVVHVRLRYVDRHHEQRLVANPRVVMGLGLYVDHRRTRDVSGVALPVATENQGHEWVGSETFEARPGQDRIRVDFTPSDQPRLLTWVGSGLAGYNSLRLSVAPTGSGPLRDVSQSDNGTGSHQNVDTGYVIQPGAHPRVVVTVVRGARPSSRVGLQVSDLVH